MLGRNADIDQRPQSSLRAKRSNPVLRRRAELLLRGACHRAGHFGPDPLAPRNDEAEVVLCRRTGSSVSGGVMGVLIDGKWNDGELPQETGQAGQFKRVDSVFRDRITADGSSGFKAEPGRYHLYVAYTCPWAHRTQIYLALKKLTGIISVAIAVPGLREQGWTFEDNAAFPDCTPDRVNGFNYLLQAYAASNPHYTGKVTVPTLWDKKTKRIVNNESSEIIRMFNAEFGALGADATDFYPKHLRAEIDRINEQVYSNVNNGVYRCGFARSQAAYDEAYDALFATL